MDAIDGGDDAGPSKTAGGGLGFDDDDDDFLSSNPPKRADIAIAKATAAASKAKPKGMFEDFEDDEDYGKKTN